MLSWSIRTIFKSDLIAGLFLVVLSYLPLFFPQVGSGKIGSLAIGASFYLGALLIGNHITVRMGGFSLISRVRGNRRNNRSFTVSVIGMALFFSLIAADLGGLWYFPYWSTTDYFFIGFVLGGWVFYVITLIVCYEALKLVLDKILPQRKRVGSYFKYEPHLYRGLFIVGLVCLSIVGAAALYGTRFFTNFHYTVNTAKSPYLPWQYWLLAFVGAVFICEYVEYRRKRSSLLKDTLHGYINPILAMILVGILLAITNEVQNLGVLLWRYANYPWPQITVLTIPVFVIMAWPLHIIAFTEFWRAFGNGSSSVVFANSKYLKSNRSLAKRKKFKRVLQRLTPVAASTRR